MRTSLSIFIPIVMLALLQPSYAGQYEDRIGDAVRKAAAETDLHFCAVDVPEGFESWGCEHATQEAIRAELKLFNIMTRLVFKNMVSNVTNFNEEKVQSLALASDLVVFIERIGTITEANIDEVATSMNEEAQVLAKRHYRYY